MEVEFGARVGFRYNRNPTQELCQELFGTKYAIFPHFIHWSWTKCIGNVHSLWFSLNFLQFSWFSCGDYYLEPSNWMLMYALIVFERLCLF